MSYIQEFETELARKLQSSEKTEAIVRWVSEKVLESYKNGLAAGRRGKQHESKGEPRSRGYSAQAR